jgi:hypothetical protein
MKGMIEKNGEAMNPYLRTMAAATVVAAGCKP